MWAQGFHAAYWGVCLFRCRAVHAFGVVEYILCCVCVGVGVMSVSVFVFVSVSCCVCVFVSVCVCVGVCICFGVMLCICCICVVHACTTHAQHMNIHDTECMHNTCTTHTHIRMWRDSYVTWLICDMTFPSWCALNAGIGFSFVLYGVVSGMWHEFFFLVCVRSTRDETLQSKPYTSRTKP